MRHDTSAILFACLLLAACGTDNAATPVQQPGEETLPKPDAAAGSVTGMPNPGTPAVLPPPAEDPTIESSDLDVEAEDPVAIDPNLPVDLPRPTLEGTFGKPPEDSMPVMPAHPPLPPEATEQSQVETPPES